MDSVIWVIIIGVIIIVFLNSNKKVKSRTEVSQNDISLLILENNKKVSMLSDEEKIKELRLVLANKLDLSKKLYDLFEEIKRYPGLYVNSKDKADGPYWPSTAIKTDELIEDKINKELIYNFNIQENRYKLIFKLDKESASWFMDDRNLNKYIVKVLENEANVVYKDNLIFSESYCEEIGWTSYDFNNGDVEILKPGEWLEHLIKISNQIKDEVEKINEVWKEKYEKDRKEEIRKNFL